MAITARASKLRVQSGLGSASRLGFKGERNLGSEMTAYFQLEAGVSFDNGQNTGHSSNISNPGQGTASSSAPNTTGVAIFSRNTFVGLKSKIGDPLAAITRRFIRSRARPIRSPLVVPPPSVCGRAPR